MLRPIIDAEPKQICIPVWDAILPAQKAHAQEYWLVTQADHAGLSGDIAAALGPPLLQRFNSEVVRAIALHDDGWTPLDAQVRVCDGKPLSFIDFDPCDFIAAWRRSIERAEKVAPIAGAMVSRHFWRLGGHRLQLNVDIHGDRELLLDFLASEQSRQERLLAGHSHEVEFLTDVLQFCDVLSLYLCCGATEDVEFPQKFADQPIRLRRQTSRHGDQAAVCRVEPSPFSSASLDLGVPARRYPPDRKPSTTMLPFLLC